MPTIGCDFDGVVHAYSRGWQDGTIYDEPMPGAFDGLIELMQYYSVFIHTTRDEEQTMRWLSARKMLAITDEQAGRPQFWDKRGVLLVSNRKLPAVAYIDDRGIRFENWEQALADVRRWCP